MERDILNFFKGEVKNDEKTLDLYSRDASICEVRPRVVVFPKDTNDITSLVRYVKEHKSIDRTLSVTARSAGTCMAGGSLSESIIIDFIGHFGGVKNIQNGFATVLPGTFYRDFEKETLKQGLILPCYTASKNICAIGGMIGNNAAGEKTLLYGKMENFIESLKVVLSDGNEYEFGSLSRVELEKKISLTTFEGGVYRDIWNLMQEKISLIKNSKPNVSKNSAGYFIWNVCPSLMGEADAEDKHFFDLTKLFVGSQGTLGIVTEAKIRLVPVKEKSKLFVIFMNDLKNLSRLVNDILPLHPESLESYDDDTLKLAIRFFPEMLKSMKVKNFLKLILSFIPEGLMMARGGVPKLILLVEFCGNNENEIDAKMQLLMEKVKIYGLETRLTRSMEESQKYWTIRRESFNLLRKHIHGKRTVPFVDDVIVRPEFLPEFLPKMKKILDDYKLTYTIAGHAGNGNFHIIPLMDMKNERNRDVILEVSDKVYDLVAHYHGSITAEHNDGIIRTPYLSKIYSKEMLDVFGEIKKIFDPQNIFNPGKKVGGSLEYLKSHIAKK